MLYFTWIHHTLNDQQLFDWSCCIQTTDNMINNALHSVLVCFVVWLVYNNMSSTNKHDSDKDDETEQCSKY